MNLARDISKAGSAEIAQQADFATGAGFADCYEIEPAIIVVVDGGKSPAALPAQIGQWDTLETLAFDVPPQTDAGRASVRERKVHPTVFIEIECDDADGGWKIFFCEIDAGQRRKLSFARIQVDRCALAAACKNEIDGAIVVKVRGDEAGASCIDAESGFGGNIGEGAVAIVAPENIMRLGAGRGIARRHGDVEVQIAVVVVVDEGDADAAWLAANAHGLRDVRELAVAFVAQQVHAFAEANGEVGVAVIVEITCGAAEAAAF